MICPEWEFRLDNGHGFEEKWMEVPWTDAETMAVPASYNDQKVSSVFGITMDGYFIRRRFRFQSFCVPRVIVLRLVVTQHARVYWNGMLFV